MNTDRHSLSSTATSHGTIFPGLGPTFLELGIAHITSQILDVFIIKTSGKTSLFLLSHIYTCILHAYINAIFPDIIDLIKQFLLFSMFYRLKQHICLIYYCKAKDEIFFC